MVPIFKITAELTLSAWLAVTTGHASSAEKDVVFVDPGEYVVVAPEGANQGESNFVGKNNSKDRIVMYPQQPVPKAPWKKDECFAPIAHENTIGSIKCSDLEKVVPLTEGHKDNISADDYTYLKLTTGKKARLYDKHGDYIETIEPNTNVYIKEYAPAGVSNKNLVQVFAIERSPGTLTMGDRRAGTYSFIEYKNLK